MREFLTWRWSEKRRAYWRRKLRLWREWEMHIDAYLPHAHMSSYTHVCKYTQCVQHVPKCACSRPLMLVHILIHLHACTPHMCMIFWPTRENSQKPIMRVLNYKMKARLYWKKGTRLTTGLRGRMFPLSSLKVNTESRYHHALLYIIIPEVQFHKSYLSHFKI